MKFKNRFTSKLGFLLALICACTVSASAQAQLVINEVVSSNSTVKSDTDGQFGDFVEIYNPTASAVSINGYSINDADPAPGKVYTIPASPAISIPANGYILIWCDDKNRTTGPTDIHTNFKLGASGDGVTLKNTSSVQVDQVTVPNLATNESYSRVPNGNGNFEKSSTATPLASNIGSSIPPNPDAGLIIINEVLSANTIGIQDEDGIFADWIELYNTSTTKTVNMQNLRLQSASKSWTFPSGITIPPGGYLVVLGNDTNPATTGPRVHMNFNVSHSGETINYLNSDGSFISSVVVPSLPQDNTYGRNPNGSATATFNRSIQPTPGAANVFPAIVNNPDASNIVINEVESNNGTGLRGEDGNVADWIELYNRGAVAVNMQGLILADSTTVWQFPAGITLNPGQYIVVLESDKSQAPTSPCPPLANAASGGKCVHMDFGVADAGEQVRFLNKDAVALIDSVNVPAMVLDTSYGRDPNGTGGFRVFPTPTPEVANTIVTCTPDPNASLIAINELAPDNETGLKDEDNTPQDWIEIYNTGGSVVNLFNFKLRDATNSWAFPSVNLNPGQYLVVFASNKDRTPTNGQPLHTNFRLESNGETVDLLDNCNNVKQTVTWPQTNADWAWIRLPNLTGPFRHSPDPTSGAANVLVYGDVNKTKSVSVTDASLTLRYALTKPLNPPFTAAEIYKADVNSANPSALNGVTVSDASLILRRSLGKPSGAHFPIEP